LNFLCNLKTWVEDKTASSAAQVWRYEVLLSLGILRGVIPVPAFTSPTIPQGNKFHWFWEIYFSYIGVVFNSLLSAVSHDRARQVKAITSVLYFVTLV
jgi:hypothetical protein